MRYQGNCHCGEVEFNFTGPEIINGLRCNCSICRRKGATMTAYTIEPSAINIDAKEGSLSVYEFGSCVAKHYFCNRCGIYTFHQSMSKPDQYRINTGCIKGIESSTLPFEVFDGASI